MIKWRGDRVVVDPFPELKTTSGISLASGSVPKMKTGRVIGVGREVQHIKVGDIVYFLRWVGNKIHIENTDAIYFSAYHVIGRPS